METKIYIDYEMIFADKPLAIFDYLKNSSHVIRLQPSH